MTDTELTDARHFDPVRWYFLEALARRTDAAHVRAKPLLQAKLARARASLQKDLEESRNGAKLAVEPVTTGNALRELTRYLAQHATEATDVPPATATGARTELRSVRQFRSTWSKLSVHKQLNHALTQAPKNAGPINSHMLVLRSLELMRDISPDYLNRFMAYADTLLCLDQRPPEKAKPRRTPARTKSP